MDGLHTVYKALFQNVPLGEEMNNNDLKKELTG